MIVVVSRTIIIKAISIPIIQNRIESECHFLIILLFLFFFYFYSSKVNGIKIKKKRIEPYILAQFMLWHPPFFYRDVSISFK